MSKSILLIAGEISGDMYGADLAKALKQRQPDLDFFGLGGDAMQDCDVKLLEHTNSLAIMGFSEILPKIIFFGKLIKKIEKEIKEKEPIAIVFIDYPGFNLKLAKKLKNLAVPKYYYIPPKVWAWRRKRINTLKKYVDKLFVIFPFEKSLYKAEDINVEYVGNPLIHQISKVNFKNEEDTYFDKDAKYKVALLPGSRIQEIKNMLPVMLKTAKRLSDQNISFVIAAPNEYIEEKILEFTDVFKIYVDATLSIVKNADAAIITSGTASLEAALLKTPHILIYRTSKITFWLVKKFLKIRYVGLVNIILKKSVCPEILQDALTPSNLSQELETLLFQKKIREDMSQEFEKISELLGTKSSPDIIAERILEVNHLH